MSAEALTYSFILLCFSVICKHFAIPTTSTLHRHLFWSSKFRFWFTLSSKLSWRMRMPRYVCARARAHG